MAIASALLGLAEPRVRTGGNFSEDHLTPSERAQVERQAIQSSAWTLLETEQKLRETARNAHFGIIGEAMGGLSLGQRIGLDDRTPLKRAQDRKVGEIAKLHTGKLDAVKDFFLTLKVLVPADPVFRGIETCEDPIQKLVDRAHEWIVPLPQDAVQLDRDLERQ